MLRPRLPKEIRKLEIRYSLPPHQHLSQTRRDERLTTSIDIHFDLALPRPFEPIHLFRTQLLRDPILQSSEHASEDLALKMEEEVRRKWGGGGDGGRTDIQSTSAGSR